MSLLSIDAVPIVLNGAQLYAEASGALWWPAEATLVVADLHFEKGSSFARHGTHLPPYDTMATLDRLAEAIRPEIQRVICLGDSFHDSDGPARLGDGDRDTLARLTASREWIWIAGNHDPALPDEIGGEIVANELRFGALAFRHVASRGPAEGEISGHYHPRAGVRVRGRRIAGPCFIHDGGRLVMPAFGAYTGGLDVSDPALAALFAGPPSIHLLARRRIITLTA